MLDLENDFTCTETETNVHFISKKPNKNGFKFEITFTKDKDEHKESMDAIKEFFIREIFLK